MKLYFTNQKECFLILDLITEYAVRHSKVNIDVKTQFSFIIYDQNRHILYKIVLIREKIGSSRALNHWNERDLLEFSTAIS